MIILLKKKYFELKNFYNLKDYINEEENKKYKISIIYSFSKANIIDDIYNEMSIIFSEINSENLLKKRIDEIKIKNNKSINNYNIIIIHFELFNSKIIQFTSNFIIKNFKDDKYSYIFILHIKRNFETKIEERINSIPDINPDINQLFIDNLNGTNFRLKDLLDKNIKAIINSIDNKDLYKEFKRTLTNFIFKELNEKRNSLINGTNVINKYDYIDEIQKYMDEEVKFKEKIIETVKELINNDKDLDRDGKSLVDKVLKMNYIDKNSIDIISCLLEYIKQQIFSKHLKYLFKVLEDNNILTTLIEIKKNKIYF